MKKVGIAAVLAVLLSLLSASPGSTQADESTLEALREAVTLDAVRAHQQAFQGFADATDGTRAAGSAGYDLSADYVVGLLEAAGYTVERPSFQFNFFEENTDSTFSQVTPVATDYVDGEDFDTMTFSGSGDTGVQTVTAVDLALDDRASSSSGCEAEDFDGFPSGDIALTQRGACSFAQKATNAENAGAVGLIVFNQGNTEDREGLLFGTLGAPGSGIPVVGTTFAIGEELALADGPTAQIVVDATSEVRTTTNVIATSTTGDPDNVVMAGAHLDSVPEGPGVQDNGTGSAAILEIALQMASEFGANDPDSSQLKNAVRFGWWGAEEFGLLGSIDYVVNLSNEDLAKIKVYQNYDMIGSPNFVRFVYDSDGSDITPEIAVPANSAILEQTFLDYFESEELETEPTIIGQRSDHFAFCVSGVPCGGLFTGAEGIKTAEQVEIYGGVEGEQYDQCYHEACDTFDNISLTALDQNSDAAATAMGTYAFAYLCNGLPATIVGTDGRDIINGTGGDDVIVALGGNDDVNGGAGNDTICLGEGNDDGVGAGGDDYIDGEGGNDLITAGSGNDTAMGGEGDDRIRVQRGDDVADGGPGNDRVEGDGGADILNGGDDDDTIIGGAGDDTLGGDDGNDRIEGDGGVDTMSGGEGNDRMAGGADGDIMNGDAGDDVLRGEGGDDLLDGGADFDRLFGDTGDDTCNNGEQLQQCENIDELIAGASALNAFELIMAAYELRDHDGNRVYLS